MTKTLEKIKTIIDSCEIISFDIFDTLLFRPLARPIDVFLCLGDKTYYKSRLKAETLAIDRYNKEDVSLDEIYSVMPNKYEHLKQAEINFETKILKPNPEMLEVLNYAKKCEKKVIITSDMYLPKDVIENILKINNIEYDKLYLSNELNRRKSTGNLFKYIKDTENIEYNKMFHIGDSKHSDFNTPKELGINAYHYPNIFEKFFDKNPKWQKFYKKYKSPKITFLLGSVIVALHILGTKKEQLSYWNKIGTIFGGTAGFAFLKMIEEDAIKDHLNKILFVARDGYTLKAMFETFNTSINSEYVYAPRLVHTFFKYKNKTANKDDITLIENFTKEYNRNTTLSIDAIVSKYLEEYSDYIKTIDINEKCGIIDSNSSSFSAKKLIDIESGFDNIGFYYSILSENYDKKTHKSFYSNNKNYSYGQFIEFLMSSPEKPILLIENLKPVYQEKLSTGDQFCIDVYPQIYEGMLEYAKYISTINEIDLSFGEKEVKLLFEFFEKNPTEEDETYMSNIKNGIDPLNKISIPVFPKWNKKCIKLWGIPIITFKRKGKQ